RVGAPDDVILSGRELEVQAVALDRHPAVGVDDALRYAGGAGRVDDERVVGRVDLGADGVEEPRRERGWIAQRVVPRDDAAAASLAEVNHVAEVGKPRVE